MRQGEKATQCEVLEMAKRKIEKGRSLAMDIRSNGSYPGSDLSNFDPHRFWLDGVECGSMEGLLQSLKFEEVPLQAKMCKLVGKAAKRRGEACNVNLEETAGIMVER